MRLAFRASTLFRAPDRLLSFIVEVTLGFSPHPTSSVLSISPGFAPCLDVQCRIARERVLPAPCEIPPSYRVRYVRYSELTIT
jgi:hypothetical protein